MADNASFASYRQTTESRKNKRRTFPVRLHQLLTDVEITGQTHIISWQPHGRSFVVHKKDEFCEQLLPRYFNQSKWSSFQRQLNLYSFQRLSAGIDRGAYYHRFFLRGEPDLVDQIQRTKVKGTGTRRPADASRDPNFYTEPIVNPPAEPNPLIPGLGNSLYPSLSMQLPSVGRLLPQAQSATAAAFATQNERNAAMLQHLLGPQLTATTNPYMSSRSVLPTNHQPGLSSLPLSSQEHLNRMLLAQRLGGTGGIPFQQQQQQAINPIVPIQERRNIPGLNLPPSGAAFASLPGSVSSQEQQQSGTIPIEGARGVSDMRSLPTEANDDENDSKPAAVERADVNHDDNDDGDGDAASADPNRNLQRANVEAAATVDAVLGGDSKSAAVETGNEQRSDRNDAVRTETEGVSMMEGNRASVDAGTAVDGDEASSRNRDMPTASEETKSNPNPPEVTRQSSVSGEGSDESPKDEQAFLRGIFD